MADGKTGSLIPCVDDVVRECDVCRAFDVAPSIPVSGASLVASFNEKVQVDVLFLEHIFVLRVLDLFPVIASLRLFGRRFRAEYVAHFAPRRLRFWVNPDPS